MNSWIIDYFKTFLVGLKKTMNKFEIAILTEICFKSLLTVHHTVVYG
jgi:hypothetical protein